MLKGELAANNLALKQEISQSVNARMDTVEEKVGKQLERTLERLAQLNNGQQEQGKAIAILQSERKEAGGMQSSSRKCNRSSCTGGAPPPTPRT